MEWLLRFFDFASLYYIYMHTDKSLFQKHAENLEYELYENLHLPLNEISYEFALIPEVFYKTIHEHIVLLKEMKPDNLSSSGPGI